MNRAAAIINELARSGVELSKSGDRLVIDGPKAAVTDALIEKVRESKPEILRCLDEWSSEDWQAFFGERAGIAEFDGGLSRADAEAVAFECCVVEWLNRHPCQSDPGRCVACGKPDRDGHTIVPIGMARHGHTWLHPECWQEWHQEQRTEAVAALHASGIAKPSCHQQETQTRRGGS